MTLGLMNFEGSWQVGRRIENAEGPEARFEGVARFEPDGAGLVYAEEGELQLEGQPPIRGERRYLWRQEEDGTIAVFFDDGRDFHRFDPGAEAPGDRHHCAPDVYDVTYDFGGWPEWESRWRVTGPRKDYVMVSRYRR